VLLEENLTTEGEGQGRETMKRKNLNLESSSFGIDV